MEVFSQEGGTLIHHTCLFQVKWSSQNQLEQWNSGGSCLGPIIPELYHYHSDVQSHDIWVNTSAIQDVRPSVLARDMILLRGGKRGRSNSVVWMFSHKACLFPSAATGSCYLAGKSVVGGETHLFSCRLFFWSKSPELTLAPLELEGRQIYKYLFSMQGKKAAREGQLCYEKHAKSGGQPRLQAGHLPNGPSSYLALVLSQWENHRGRNWYYYLLDFWIALSPISQDSGRFTSVKRPITLVWIQSLTGIRSEKLLCPVLGSAGSWGIFGSPTNFDCWLMKVAATETTRFFWKICYIIISPSLPQLRHNFETTSMRECFHWENFDNSIVCIALSNLFPSF